MKKLFLTLAATALCTTAFAGQRILYQQNFDQTSDAAATGWTYGGSSMSIASDDWGKFLELSQGQSNGRSAKLTWGAEIFQDADGNSLLTDGKYTVTYDFSIAQNSNNQYNSGFTVFTNHTPKDNEPYCTPFTASAKGPWDNFLIDIVQANDAADADMIVSVNPPTEFTGLSEDGKTALYNINKTETYTLSTSTWYTVTLNVDVNTRTVEYDIVDLSGNPLTSGTRIVPETDVNGEAISMLAEGLFIMVARYQTIIDVDNIKVMIETDYEYANTPGVALTRLGKTAEDIVDLNLRAYTCTFYDFETLHVKGTDGKEFEVSYDDCDGAYVYETTTSGTLEVWTTCGNAKSEVVTETVECVPVVLPAAEATISSVSDGYVKTYTLSVSNKEVPLQPTIFIDYEFVGKSGEKINGKEAASGEKINVTEEGVLTITTSAFGYESKTVEVKNNIEFAKKQEWDFARMSDEEIAAAGFTTWNELNSSSQSGFNNWTARKRLYYLLEGSNTINEEGNEVWTNVYPFGFVAEDNTTNVIVYSVIEDNSDNTKYFEGLNFFDTDRHVGYMKHLGMYNDETANNNNDVTILNVDATDFVVVNTIDNYGGDSNHPVCATDAEYFDQLTGTDYVLNAKLLPSEGNLKKNGVSYAVLNEETGLYDIHYALYRIQTVLTNITVYKQLGDAVEGVEAEVAGDNYYYTIDGIRLAQPTQKGLYIHNGKKVIVK